MANREAELEVRHEKMFGAKYASVLPFDQIDPRCKTPDLWAFDPDRGQLAVQYDGLPELLVINDLSIKAEASRYVEIPTHPRPPSQIGFERL